MSCYTRLIATRPYDAARGSTALDFLAERFLGETDPALRAMRLEVYATKLISDAHGHALIAGASLAANDDGAAR